MSESRKQYSGKDKDIYEYLKTHDVNHPQKLPAMDLRAYEKYINEHNLSYKDITQDIIDMFVVKK